MTKKDYEFFVQWIAKEQVQMNAVYKLVDYFQEQNRKFDVKRFADALYSAMNKELVIGSNSIKNKHHIQR